MTLIGTQMADCLTLVTGDVCKGVNKSCMKYQSTALSGTPCKQFLDQANKKENKNMRDVFDDARSSVCRRFPDIPQCACMGRFMNDNYLRLSDALKFASQDDDQCWYKGCRDPESVMMPYSMTKKPTDQEPFYDPLRIDTSTCSPAVCNNVLDLGGADIGMAKIIQDSSSCGAKAPARPPPSSQPRKERDFLQYGTMGLLIILIIVLILK